MRKLTEWKIPWEDKLRQRSKTSTLILLDGVGSQADVEKYFDITTKFKRRNSNRNKNCCSQ